MSAADVLTVRMALCSNGYTPVPLFGKEPPIYGKNNPRKGLDRWQELNNVNRSMCEMWSRLWPDAENTGILTARTPAFDADILNEEAAVAAEALIKERFEERGYCPVRIGLPPKRALLFRTLVPFDKITVNFEQTRGKPEKIEFLCNGQQLVVAGIHPDTGKPYNWFGGEPWTIKQEDLPYISAEEAQQLVDDVVELLVRDFGYMRAADRPKRKDKSGNGPFVNDQLANEADWQYLIANILKGDALHDSLRDLAAKYAASGMSGGAIVNSLRALMEASTAPHDGRWQERFDDIPRLVQSALEKYAPEEEEPEEEPEEEAPQQPPGAGAQQAPGTGQAPGGGPQQARGAGQAPGGGTQQQARTTAASGLGEWNAADDVDAPPPRGWLLGNTFARAFLSSILGAGGVGKTALRYAQALSLATGRTLTNEHIFQRCRVLIVSLEDDDKELRRRVRAARIHHKVALSEVDGWLFLAAPGAKGGKLLEMDRRGRVKEGALRANLEAAIIAHKIDLVMLDPFIKTHSIEENLNSAIDDVVQILTDLATKHNIAVDAPHHVRKGATEPGDAEAGRGASSLKDAARLVTTCMPMNEQEAKIFGIPQEDRREYIRIDSGKVNITKSSRNAQWFHLVNVPLDNMTTLYPAGDQVQTVEPWEPPNAWSGTSSVVLNAILTDIDQGLTDNNGQPTGRRYTNAPAAKDRQVWPVVQKHYPQKSEGECRTIIHAWLGTGLLYPEDYDDPVDRKPRKGLKVDDAKRPS
jgi:AAA domain-containing protein/bifunctional DNA primase/polymerase-like protein